LMDGLVGHGSAGRRADLASELCANTDSRLPLVPGVFCKAQSPKMRIVQLPRNAAKLAFALNSFCPI